jgi:hypothetical protein
MPKPQQVDSKVPRAKAAFHAVIPAIAFVAGDPVAPYLLAFTGAAMAISVVAGPRYSLFGRLFKDVIVPAAKIAPGHPEDAAPHRFSETLGAVMLLAAAVLYPLGAPWWLPQAFTLIVVALAALNAAAGICIGCQMYLLIKRTQGRAA